MYPSNTGAVQDKIVDALSALVPEVRTVARELLERVSTPNWGLEWGLPGWLSQTFAFSDLAQEELLLSNIYMIAYARLLDDLADQDSPANNDCELVLESLLHHTWLRQYVLLFNDHAPDPAALARFWNALDGYMGEWLRATQNRSGEGFPPFEEYTETDFQRLAARGAFLKICPAAACGLAGRENLIPSFALAMENLTVGVVMLDEQFDWDRDLDAGRYNTFVAYCSDLPQIEAYKDRNTENVLKEIYLKRLGQPYFEILIAHLQEAQHWAAHANCARLGDYIAWYENEARICANYFAETSRAQMRSAAGIYKNTGWPGT